MHGSNARGWVLPHFSHWTSQAFAANSLPGARRWVFLDAAVHFGLSVSTMSRRGILDLRRVVGTLIWELSSTTGPSPKFQNT